MLVWRNSLSELLFLIRPQFWLDLNACSPLFYFRFKWWKLVWFTLASIRSSMKHTFYTLCIICKIIKNDCVCRYTLRASLVRASHCSNCLFCTHLDTHMVCVPTSQESLFSSRCLISYYLSYFYNRSVQFKSENHVCVWISYSLGDIGFIFHRLTVLTDGCI